MRISKVLAEKIPVVIGEKTYFLSYLTDKIRSQYERHLEEMALKNLQRQKQVLGEDYIACLTATNQAIVSGAYAFGKTAYYESMKSLNGMCQMLLLLLQVHQPQMTIEEVNNLVLEHSGEILAGVSKALGSDDTKKKQSKSRTKTSTSNSITV